MSNPYDEATLEPRVAFFVNQPLLSQNEAKVKTRCWNCFANQPRLITHSQSDLSTVVSRANPMQPITSQQITIALLPWANATQLANLILLLKMNRPVRLCLSKSKHSIHKKPGTPPIALTEENKKELPTPLSATSSEKNYLIANAALT